MNMHELTKVSFKHAYSTTHYTLYVRFIAQKNYSDHLSEETQGILSSARFPEKLTHTQREREKVSPIPALHSIPISYFIPSVKSKQYLSAKVTSVSFPEIRSLLF